eukprot:m.161383 g.161383  ORF g.161383 m.161383 type:complete len:563 (-) comp13401_c0_seq1:1925-3613(-)
MSTQSRSKQLQKQVEKLSVENDVMERRLLELKKNLRKQREERKAKGGHQWRSGGKGRMGGHASNVLHSATATTTTSANKKKSARRHIPKPPTTSSTTSGRNTARNAAKPSSYRKEKGGFRRAMPHPPSQPRTATSSAGITPTSLSLSSTRSSQRASTQGFQSSPSSREASRGVALNDGLSSNNPSQVTTPGSIGMGHSLYEGVYDEERQAQEFKRAVEEWRRGTTVETPSNNAALSSSSTSSPITKTTGTAQDGSVDPSYPPLPKEGGGKLLHGPAFDEGESHASFVEAVEQWRDERRKVAEKKKKTWNQSNTVVSNMATCETQADDTDAIKRNITPDISFQSNLTYLEKLMLKKKRSTPTPSRSQSRTGDELPPSHPRTLEKTLMTNTAVPEDAEGLISFADSNNINGDDDDDDDVVPRGDVQYDDVDGDDGDIDDGDDMLFRQINSLSLSQQFNSMPKIGPSSTFTVQVMDDDVDEADAEEADASDAINNSVVVEEVEGGGPQVDEPETDSESEADVDDVESVTKQNNPLLSSLNASMNSQSAHVGGLVVKDAMEDLFGN